MLGVRPMVYFHENFLKPKDLFTEIFTASVTFRLKSSPSPFYVSRSHGGERLRRSGPSTHLSESPPQELAPATRLNDKPRRLPRFHRARPSTALDERRRSPAGRPACLAGNYITSGRRMQCPPARISCGFRAAHLAATLSMPRREVSAHREKTS